MPADRSDIDSLLRRFREAVAEHWDTDSDIHNRAIARTYTVWLRLQETPEGRAAVLGLLADPDPGVRFTAGICCLPWAPEQARPILDAIRLIRDEDQFGVRAAGPWLLLETGGDGTFPPGSDPQTRWAQPRHRGPSDAKPRGRLRRITRDDIRKAIHRAGLRRHADDLVGHVRDSVRIWCRPAQDGDLPVGASKLGGLPDLPPGTTWPEWKGLPMSLVAQISLTDTAPHDVQGLLPRQGALQFFFDRDQMASGSDPSDGGGCRVLYHVDVPQLRRTSAPADPPPECLYPAFGLSFCAQLALLPWDSEEFRRLGLSEDETDRYIERVAWPVDRWQGGSGGDADDIVHRLLGHPDLVQGDVFLTCQLASHGIAADSDGLADPRAADLAQGTAEWQVLLQVGSEIHCSPEMMWGDMGTLYFCIRQADLKAHGFSKVWPVLQCH